MHRPITPSTVMQQNTHNTFLFSGSALTLLLYLWELSYRPPTTGLGVAMTIVGAVATMLVPLIPRVAWLTFQITDAIAMCMMQSCGPVPSTLVSLLFALGIIAYNHRPFVVVQYVLVSIALQICFAMIPNEYGLTLADVPSFAVMFLTAVLIGGSLRTHDRLLQERLQAERVCVQLESQQRNTRLAQSIHDSVTGNLSFIARMSHQRQSVSCTPSDVEAWSNVNEAATLALQRTYQVIDSLDGTEQPSQSDSSWDKFIRLLHDVATKGDESAQALKMRGHGTIQTLAHASLSEGTKALVVDIVRELYANILRHARPDTLYGLSIMIDCDGVQITQFNQIAQHNDATLQSGHGLAMLRRRIEHIHGSLSTRCDGNDWTAYIDIPAV